MAALDAGSQACIKAVRKFLSYDRIVKVRGICLHDGFDVVAYLLNAVKKNIS